MRYYRDPHRHPQRKFIGIVFEKEQVLPQPPHAAKRRQLGMLAYQIPPTPPAPTPSAVSPPPQIKDATSISIRPSAKNPGGLNLTLRPGYQYRQSNFEIGRSGEKKEAAAEAKGKTTRAFAKFKPGDRFAAWRKSAVRVARNNERRVMGRGGKGGQKKKN